MKIHLHTHVNNAAENSVNLEWFPQINENTSQNGEHERMNKFHQQKEGLIPEKYPWHLPYKITNC